MIKVKHLPGSIRITLLPNRSLTWQQTKLVICAFGGFCLSIALIWTFVGAWLILPFAGIEIGLLAFVMYLVSSRTYQQQILQISDQYLCFIAKRRTAVDQVLFQRSQVKLITYEVNHPEDVKELYLIENNKRRRIGEFLNLEDQANLLMRLNRLDIHEKEIKRSVEIQF